MRLSCPQCPAIYEVPDALLSRNPARMRCTQCGAEFVSPATAIVIAVQKLPEPVSESLPEPMTQQPDRVAAAPMVQDNQVVMTNPAMAEASIDTADRPYPEPEPEPTVEIRQARAPQAEILSAEPEAGSAGFNQLLQSARGTPGDDAPTPSAGRTTHPWLVSFLALLVIVGVLYVLRGQIMHAWPPSIRLYQALKLTGKAG
ncbi:MAG TPA: zinc-ribbon domain-containing protein [Acetobacteraceae bacterium]|nr:zinc-ribbon domain-containing protein [Acetobacteraceae bacterium]HQU02468.1 zinc-ribbon domain-containing protein [Acetobacteraceae bacterium]